MFVESKNSEDKSSTITANAAVRKGSRPKRKAVKGGAQRKAITKPSEPKVDDKSEDKTKGMNNQLKSNYFFFFTNSRPI